MVSRVPVETFTDIVLLFAMSNLRAHRRSPPSPSGLSVRTLAGAAQAGPQAQCQAWGREFVGSWQQRERSWDMGTCALQCPRWALAMGNRRPRFWTLGHGRAVNAWEQQGWFRAASVLKTKDRRTSSPGVTPLHSSSRFWSASHQPCSITPPCGSTTPCGAELFNGPCLRQTETRVFWGGLSTDSIFYRRGFAVMSDTSITLPVFSPTAHFGPGEVCLLPR